MRIRFVVPKLARPSLHRHAFKVATNTKLLIEHPTEFTVSHSSSSRNRKLSHKRSEGWIEKIAGDLSPADGIWAVAGDDFLAKLLRRAHAICQSVNEGIDTTADALEIDHDYIDVLEHLFSRLARLAVERIDRQACIAIDAVTGFDHVVLHVAANAMLRAKQSR